MRRSTWAAVPLILAALVVEERQASAAPTVRTTKDVYGDVLVVGGTLGWDCGRCDFSGATPDCSAAPVPAGATVDCTGETSATAADKAPDIFWQDATASHTVLLSTDARTSATLTLPSGATVVAARLYWGAQIDGTAITPPVADASVQFGKAGADATVTASAGECTTTPSTGPVVTNTYIAYQCSHDVTSMVGSSGEYRVSDVSGVLFDHLIDDGAFSGWLLVVVVSQPGAPYRHVTMLDGLDAVTTGTTSAATVSGFRLATSGKAELTIWGWSGGNGALNAAYDGDQVSIAGGSLSNALNPASDFFNQTRSIDGVGAAGTTPALSGAASTMAGIDLDALDVTSKLSAGATSYTVTAATSKESYLLGGLVSSVQSAAPKLDVTKTFVDLDGTKVVAGDTLEFTITTANSGDDDAIAVGMRDALASGLVFVPGSISIDGVTKTDAAGDDQAELTAATSTVTARLGAGADATTGGTLASGASTTVTFRATVSASPGTTTNQAFVNAAGAGGAPATDSPSDGDATTPGAQATSIVVVECQGARGCPTGFACDDATSTCAPVGSDAGDAGDASDAGCGLFGQACMFTSDCCPALVCVAPDGSISGICESPDAGADGGSDAASDTASDAASDTGATDGVAGDSSGGGDTTTLADSGVIVDSSSGGDTSKTDTSTGADTSGSQDGSLVNDATSAGDTGGKIPDADLITEGSGCACSAPGGARGSADEALLVVGLGALVAAFRRRRRR